MGDKGGLPRVRLSRCLIDVPTGTGRDKSGPYESVTGILFREKSNVATEGVGFRGIC